MNFNRLLESIPDSWDKVSLRQAMALLNISGVSAIDALPEYFVALDIDYPAGAAKQYKHTLNLKISEAVKVMERLKFIYALPDSRPSEILRGFPLKDFRSLTFAEFIDADTLISRGLIDNLHQLAAILYSSDENYSYVERRIRAELLLSLPLSSVWPAINAFTNYRAEVFSSYEGLFRVPVKDDAEEEEKVVDDFADRFGRMGYLSWLSGDDITKHRTILALGHIECFNQLAFFEERRQRTEDKNSLR